MEKGESVESSQTLSIRLIVLPPISASLRVAWNTNGENLRHARIFSYLAWIQSITRVVYLDRVAQFVQSYSKETATTQVDGWTIDFICQDVRVNLEITIRGQLIEDMPGLTKSQYKSLFEGSFPRTPKGCCLEAVVKICK